MGQKSREKIIAEFDEKLVIEKYLEVIKNINFGEVKLEYLC